MLSILLLFKYNLLFFKKTLNESRYSSIEIEKILSKVRNKEPLLYTKKIDKTKLESAGINLNKPIYVEQAKFISMKYAKNLWLAKQIQNFNLIIFYNESQSVEKLKTFFKNDAKFLNISDLSKDLKENLLKLNINHNEKQELDFKQINEIKPKNLKESFEKSVCFNDFCLEKVLKNQNFNLNIRQTYFKGEFFFINAEFSNTSTTLKNFQIMFSKVLSFERFDYLVLNKEKNYYLIKSLLNNFKCFLYSSEKIKNIRLIKIKNSQAYNLKCEFELRAKDQNQKSFWIYIGKIPVHQILDLEFDELKKNAFEQIFNIILNKIKRQFNLKLNSLSRDINFYFNTYLPKRIILENLKNITPVNALNEVFKTKNNESSSNDVFKTRNNENSEIKNDESFLKTISFKQLISMHRSKQLSAYETYNLMSNKLLLQKDNFLYINKTELKNYELKLFFENKLKSIFVKSDIKKRLIIGDISYYNCQNISLKTLKDYDNFEVRI